MNTNKTVSSLLISLAAFALFAAGETAIASPPAQPGLTLEIAADKSVYLPGELVTLSFKVANTSPVRKSLYRPEAGKGDLEVLVRYGEGEFRTYSGPGWGREDAVAPEIDVAPGETFEVSTTMLYNICPDTAHLSRLYSDQIRRKRLDTV